MASSQCHQFGESSKMAAKRAAYASNRPNVVNNIIKSGKAHGQKLIPRTCYHTDNSPQTCSSCRDWLKQIDAGITGPDANICDLHYWESRDSRCRDCITFTRQLESGQRVLGVHVKFNEDIWSSPPSYTFKNDQRGPCNERATNISLAEFREQYHHIDSMEALQRDLYKLRMDVNRVHHGLQHALTELYTPVLPCFDFGKDTKFHKFLRKWEFNVDLRKLNVQCYKLLHKFWTPGTIECRVPNWNSLQATMDDIESNLIQLEEKLNRSGSDSDSNTVDEKEVENIRTNIIDQARASVDHIIDLLKSWTTAHRDLQWSLPLTDKSYIYFTETADVPLVGKHHAALRYRSGSLEEAENRRMVKENIKLLKEERGKRRNDIEGRGNAQFKKIQGDFERILRRFRSSARGGS